MTRSSVMTAVTMRIRKEASATREAPAFEFRRLLVAPALLALGLFAVSCGSSSPSGPSPAASLVSKGLSAEAAGQTQQALKDFMAAIAKDHTDAKANYELGVLYQQRLNKPALAADAYKNALKDEPKYKSAMFNLAILDTQTNPQAAQNLYTELLLLNRNDPNVLFNLGLLLISENQPIPGHAALKKAIALDPSLARRVPAGITP